MYATSPRRRSFLQAIPLAAFAWRLPTCLPLRLLPLLLLVGCAGPALRDDIHRDPPSYSAAPAERGPLHAVANAIEQEHGKAVSGFHLLDGGQAGLDWRLALIDSAVSSVDIQTYLWYPDHSGSLLLDRTIRAADRGVKVRLIVDDLLTIGLDEALVDIVAHPNIDLRIFNPWRKRGVAARGGEMVVELRRLNIRMHDKLMVVDGRAAIIGGRNIGDHYFGLSHAYNFHDLDVLGFGAVAGQAAGFFDHFWNSEWVISAANIDLEPDSERGSQALDAVRENLAAAAELERFPRLPRDWSAELEALRPQLHAGRSLVVYDRTEGDAIDQEVAATLLPAMSRATEELLITNAYIIPDTPAIEFTRHMTSNGVRVRILTNSLESHDVPAVNSHYKSWRDDFIDAGAELYELRADPAIQSLVDVPPVSGGFVGLHTKAFVVDRELVFIGSMNFDPRSIAINTEGGIYIESPGLGEALAAIMERDMAPENAWRVTVDEAGDLHWTHADRRVDRQPARSAWQRFMDLVFRLFPRDLY